MAGFRVCNMGYVIFSGWVSVWEHITCDKEKHGLQPETDLYSGCILGVAKDLGEFVGFLAGGVVEVFPVWSIMLIGAVLNFVGYGLIWLLVTSRLPTLPLWIVNFVHHYICQNQWRDMLQHNSSGFICTELPQKHRSYCGNTERICWVDWTNCHSDSLKRISEVFDEDMGIAKNCKGEMINLLKIGLTCCEEDVGLRMELKEVVEKIERGRS
ncbi:hypothetical protein Ddye_000948 [Dipteronia dyeriana]|uniref:Nodulin-like domain-containing protein n=1 Tax=Dipteronia dyeriana TaxID=168575 RepID=A0AAD9XMM6_9ROSI|nr:hypothetical protein Ddye_000948 [Dipteronia dyeriana]